MMKFDKERFLGAWWGAYTGEAFSMPTSGYLEIKDVEKEYGKIRDMLAPKSPHPDCTMPRILSKLPKLKPQFDFINEKLTFWKCPGTHFHATLQAGENTLQLFLALHLANELIEKKKYDDVSWFKRYESVMCTPNGYNDLYVPAMQRTYFENLSLGKSPQNNGVYEANLGDIAYMLPLLLLYSLRPEHAIDAQYKIFKRFVRSEGSPNASTFLSKVLYMLMCGETLETVLFEKFKTDSHYTLAFPYRRWIRNGSDAAVLDIFSTAANLENSLPLSFYIALKYKHSFEEALCANAQLGGESSGRGSIIGMLMGAQHGTAKIPARWAEKLIYINEINALGEGLLNTFA